MKLRTGQTLDIDEAKLGTRDAFHVPGVLVTTQERLKPGEAVRFTDGYCQWVTGCSDEEKHAVVDPFLESDVDNDVAFWVFIVPGMVEDLVHHFSIKGMNTGHTGQEVEPEEEYDECAGCD